MFLALLFSAVLTPDELYLKALARLQSLPQQPFIEYRMYQTNSDLSGENRFTLDELVIERRADHTSWNAVQGGDSFPLNHVLIGQHYLVPDMFLHSGDISAGSVGAIPQLDQIDDATLKVITTVHALAKPHYDVTQMGEQKLDCGDAIHLTLHPKGDAERYNVRELWIRPSDYVICQARYNSKNFVVRRDDIANTLDVTATLNDDGLVTSWKLTGHVFMPLPGFDTKGTGTFSKFLWTQNEPGYFFDEILWTRHANEVKAQATPHSP